MVNKTFSPGLEAIDYDSGTFVGSFSLRPLFRAESAISGVAQAGDNVGIGVEVIVNRGGPKSDVRMDAAQPLDAFRRRNHAHDSDVAGAALLEPVDRGDCGVGGGHDGRNDDHS